MKLKRGNRNIKPSEYTYEYFLNIVPAVLYEIAQYQDGSSELIYLSPNAKELLGHPSEYFIEDYSRFADIIHPDDRSAFIAADENSVNDDFFTIETRIVLPSGEIRWLQISSKPVPETKHGTVIWCGLAIDITYRKRAELALQNAHSKLEEQVKARTEKLAKKSQALEEVNNALKVLLRESVTVKEEIENNILTNLKEDILPYLDEITPQLSSETLELIVNTIKLNIDTIASSFNKRLSLEYKNLTPREIQVANLIRQGKTSKDIASFFNITTNGVDFHRRNIRKKLNLKGKSKNLQSYLLEFVG